MLGWEIYRTKKNHLRGTSSAGTNVPCLSLTLFWEVIKQFIRLWNILVVICSLCVCWHRFIVNWKHLRENAAHLGTLGKPQRHSAEWRKGAIWRTRSKHAHCEPAAFHPAPSYFIRQDLFIETECNLRYRPALLLLFLSRMVKRQNPQFRFHSNTIISGALLTGTGWKHDRNTRNKNDSLLNSLEEKWHLECTKLDLSSTSLAGWNIPKSTWQSVLYSQSRPGPRVNPLHRLCSLMTHPHTDILVFMAELIYFNKRSSWNSESLGLLVIIHNSLVFISTPSSHLSYSVSPWDPT